MKSISRTDKVSRSPAPWIFCFSLLVLGNAQVNAEEVNKGIIFDENESVRNLDVKCSKAGMLVTLSFRQPFNGLVYADGFYSDDRCIFVRGGGDLEYRFEIQANGCGATTTASNGDIDGSFQNTVVIQNDPLFLEMWDTVRVLRCLWRRNYVKTVRSRPIQVYEEYTVPISLNKTAINHMTTIQDGGASVDDPVRGYLHVGSETSIVVHLNGGHLDANMMDCTALSGGSSQDNVVLTDHQGCVVQDGMVTPFYKMRETSETDGDRTMLFSYFQGYKLPRTDFVIRCRMRVCKEKCPRECTIPVQRNSPSISAAENSVYSSKQPSRYRHGSSNNGADEGDIVWGKRGRFRRDVSDESPAGPNQSSSAPGMQRIDSDDVFEFHAEVLDRQSLKQPRLTSYAQHLPFYILVLGLLTAFALSITAAFVCFLVRKPQILGKRSVASCSHLDAAGC